ncbi:MAG TPA: malto-oligosyltrehalose synthase [Candidatus Limnocylindrales bacterium]|jgi:(1->4)-alpha-D-glucan 1-alpha-D-glucosylmutase|nr:malto-oligosyltrehalose synthase [Candidatus Limnocylindrales bacterium]
MRSNPSVLAPESSGISECLDRLAAQKRSIRPLSTYRLQFNAKFGFEQARRLIGYLHALGVSHVYSSPILKARAGSNHGYDITDHNQLNPEVGSYEEFQAFVRELKNYGMGQVLDIVPNHMGIGFGANPWWHDVLANGRASEFAEFFDLDWNPLKPELRDKLLIPVLGDQYGAELEQGHIKIVCDEQGFHVEYYDKTLPIDAQTIPMIFEPVSSEIHEPELRNILSGLRNLPLHNTTDGELVRQRRRSIGPLTDALRQLIVKSQDVKELARKAIDHCNGHPGDPRSFDCLHRLLEAQVYRLAHWRVSGEEINYRRFFDINDLIGLRMENPRVFAATHQLLRKMLAEDLIQGVRIDHCDGLLNPRQYLVRLQMLYTASQCSGATPRPPLAENGIEQEVQQVFGQHDWMQNGAPLYTVVEKILEPGEDLPYEWPVDGTSGYDFTTLVNGIFIDRRNERFFTNLYHRFIGGATNVDALIYNSKKLIMHASLASEVNVLAHLLDELSLPDRYARDFTRKALRDVIRETIACFPVYRTYIDERGEITERDRNYINEAVARAKRRNPDKAPASFDFLRDILLLRHRDGEDRTELHRKKLYFTLKFQQLTGPVMAKGLEDTACYVYNRFVSVNEVGGTPKQFGISTDEFHQGNLKREEHWEFSMLATSTHDTKRSEDVRARLNVLSEMPRTWSSQVLRWRKLNRSRKRVLGDGRTVPDLNEEYLLYQTLVGSWPFDLSSPPAREQYTQRIREYMNKAVHEAKVNLSWISDDPAYVEALEQFVTRILTPGTRSRPNAFLEQMQAFIQATSLFGAVNSLAQRLLMITSPGNPDVYQGTELWDLSLVDPDNRRPVDYELRQKLISDLDRRAEGGKLPELCAEMLANYQDGRPKLWTTMQAMRLRRDRRELFHTGSYVPLHARGSKQEHVIAFAREYNGHVATIVVPRLPYTLSKAGMQLPLGPLWENTEVPVTSKTPEFLENVLTGEKIKVSGTRTLLCSEVFAHFPVALLVSS